MKLNKTTAQTFFFLSVQTLLWNKVCSNSYLLMFISTHFNHMLFQQEPEMDCYTIVTCVYVCKLDSDC